MIRPRVVAIGLDGLDLTVAEGLMASGEMPALAGLRRRAACFRLAHGSAQRTGLAWEHFASGLSPDDARRWGAVEFDPHSYRAWQEGARFAPWWAGIDRRVLVFDAPYVDLARAKQTRGLVGWGAHDPGITTGGRPDGLLAEFEQRFGPYPATRWTYANPFPSAARTQAMGDALSGALDLRARAARWLATQRFPDWDVFITVASEAHSAIEGLWHGFDASHPLHRHPSSGVAADALLAVHRSLDAFLDSLLGAWPDAAILAFNPSGMGPNNSDTASMVLLPELLYRHSFGRSLLTVQAHWAAAPRGVPILREEDNWSAIVGPCVAAGAPTLPPRGAFRSLARHLPPGLKTAFRRFRGERSNHTPAIDSPDHLDLAWQPALRYRPAWPRMQAFALPSFYDGRIRLNLRGRERDGVVEPAAYEQTCRELETLLRECRDPRTGEGVVGEIERDATRNPLALQSSEADLLVVWRGVVAALEHPRLGLVGPVPLRRTGGHTGPYGFAYVAAPHIAPGDRGLRSAFDVVPTLSTLLDVPPNPDLSGTSLL